MKITLLPTLLAFVSIASSVGCSSSGPSSPETNPQGVGDGAAMNKEETGPGAALPVVPTTSTLGVVVIDTQKVFVDTATSRNPTGNIPQVMTNSARIFTLASQSHAPFFITFEASKQGNHALPATLSTVLPSTAKEFIKTTFAATGQPHFAEALQASGLHRFVVIGAETDVCVLQSMLGMRRAGYEVLAVRDALFSEEVNTGPARRRMRQAGIAEVETQDVEALLANGASPPAPPSTVPPVIVRPLEMGFVLNDVDGLAATDPNSAAKLVRLRELLLISEWFKLPVFAADPAHALQALPANLRSVLTRPILALSARPSTVTQLAFAGGRTGVAEAIATQTGDVFVIEDALVGGTAAELEPLYVRGVVPSTYKTMYYELTQSVDDRQWPSQQWVTDGDVYFDLTKAPEDLPPLTVIAQ